MKQPASQFVTFRPRPAAAVRLFCFPHAGGSPVVFFPWSDWFSEDIECIGVQYPGRGQRLKENPLTSIAEIVSDIGVERLEFSEKPFAFYGHSFGGIVAFELARQLRRSGRPGPIHLYAGASRPPQLASPFPPIHMLPEKEFIENVESRYGGIPSAIAADPEIMKMFLPAMRGDFTAYESYQFQDEQPLHIPITAMGGADDQAVKPASLEGWKLHTDVAFDINIVPGGHFFPVTGGKAWVHALEGRLTANRNAQVSLLAS